MFDGKALKLCLNQCYLIYNMKKLVTVILLACCVCAVHAQRRMPAPAVQNTLTSWGDQGNGSYINPILNADYSDPDVIRVGEKFYMIASDFHFLGMQVLESDDMVNWKHIAQIYDKFDFPGWDEMKHYAGGSWAPSLRYHDGKFWAFFCTIDEGLFMSNAEDPAGPWSPLCNVYHIAKWEDPCPFWDDDGQAYLVRSQHGAGPIIMHKMSPDGTKLLDEGVTVYNGPVAEGPKMFKKDGYYYISIPEGGVSTGWQTILRSKDIYGPYESRRVLEQGSTIINGPHQGSIVDTPDGKWMFYHFQEDKLLGRVVHLQPMHWSEDGWPVIGVDIDRNGVGEPVHTWVKPIVSDVEPYCPQTDDDFNDSKLSPHWQFNHNPDNSKWSLTEKPGSLTLHALKADGLFLARNTITQKTMGYIGEVTTVMDVSDMKNGQRAGLACFGSGDVQVGVKMEKGKKVVYTLDESKFTQTPPQEQDLVDMNGKDKVYLRIKLNFKKQEFQCAYSFDNEEFIDCGEKFYIRWGNWKGPRVVLYSFNKEKAEGSVSFDWFTYKHDGPKSVNSIED